MSLETCVICGRTFDSEKETTLYVTAEFTNGARLTLPVCKNCEGEVWARTEEFSDPED